MASERFWREVSEPFAANGTSNGVIAVDDSEGFKVKAEVVVSATNLPNLTVEVKDIPNSHTIVVGPKGPEMNSRVDLSLYTTADNSKIVQPRQKRPSIGPGEIDRATYEEEPTVARRVIQVDEFGDKYSVKNPVPVRLSDGSINIGSVNAELEVQLSHKDNYPDAGDVHDSIRIGGRDNGPEATVNPDGSLNVLAAAGVSGMTTRVDTVENITYIGLAEAGSLASEPKWRIVRTVKQFNKLTNTEDEVTEAANEGNFDQVWDDRTSLFSVETPVDFFDRRFERLLPILSNANWMKLGDFDRVSPVFSSTSVDVNYHQDDAIIGTATIRYVSELDWSISLVRYINNTDGSMLLDDDGTQLSLD